MKVSKVTTKALNREESEENFLENLKDSTSGKSPRFPVITIFISVRKCDISIKTVCKLVK